MYRRSNISLTLSFMLLVTSKPFLCAVIRFFIHLVSFIVVSYNIYMNRLLFENEDSIIFCKQSVSSIWRDCKNRSTPRFAQSGNLLLENSKNSAGIAFFGSSAMSSPLFSTPKITLSSKKLYSHFQNNAKKFLQSALDIFTRER